MLLERCLAFVTLPPSSHRDWQSGAVSTFLSLPRAAVRAGLGAQLCLPVDTAQCHAVPLGKETGPPTHKHFLPWALSKMTGFIRFVRCSSHRSFRGRSHRQPVSGETCMWLFRLKPTGDPDLKTAGAGGPSGSVCGPLP